VDTVITKNSGGDATAAKLAAARAFGIPVILIRRPPKPQGESVITTDHAMDWIARVHGISS
ncbi:MAG: precorrin-6A/cobalt-precorrin-6A reductase, partial [Pseudomonadota bacterium]|nr:precorrin-6A/cobalt-precorrin-6A reductase [Pseudomonadota bacterium]